MTGLGTDGEDAVDGRPGEPVADPSPAARAGSKWTVGTLSYTTAGLVALFVWLLCGDFGYNLKERSVISVLLLALKPYGVSDFLVGLILMTLPQALGVIIYPIVAYRSDRHRSRWGRRIPFLLIPTPIAVLSMFGLAYSPEIGRGVRAMFGGTENFATVLSFCFFWALFEICTVVCNSVLFSLFTDVVPRAVMGRFVGLFRIVSLGSGILFNYYVLGYAEAHFAAIFMWVGVIFGLTFTIMCVKVKEGEYPPAPPPTSGTALHRLVGAVKSYLTDCFTHPYYRWIFTAVGLGYVAMTPLSLYTIYYAKALHMDMALLGKFTAVQFVISLVQSYPVGWLMDKIHPIRVTAIAFALMAAASAGALFLVHDGRSFGIAVVVCGTVSGMWITATTGLGPVLFPKIKFATFDSAMRVVYSVGVMLIGPACGWFLDHVDHQYRYMYVWTCIPCVLGVYATYQVFRGWVALGGEVAYRAPE